jgi:thioredoxin reductase (NADPH)
MYKIYTKDDCVWCVKAKRLMQDYDLKYEEYKLGQDYTKEELRSLVPAHLPLTVPQIFVYNKRIGGYEDFAEYLEGTGVLGTQQ